VFPCVALVAKSEDSGSVIDMALSLMPWAPILPYNLQIPNNPLREAERLSKLMAGLSTDAVRFGLPASRCGLVIS
jgi:hypothetical protein